MPHSIKRPNPEIKLNWTEEEQKFINRMKKRWVISGRGHRCSGTCDQPLKDLWVSTLNFHKRFRADELADCFSGNSDYKVRMKAIQSSVGMLREEASEVEQAAFYEEDSHVVEEVADVMVTLIGVLFARGLPFPQLIEAIDTVIQKNDAKTHDTHYVDSITGKIKRREE